MAYNNLALAAERTDEFLDAHPSFLEEYLCRNPEFLDNFVEKNVDHETAEDWVKKIAKRPYAIDALTLKCVSFMRRQNDKHHKTEQYIHAKLIVRRADTFEMKLYFNGRQYLPSKDKIVLVFSIGANPDVKKGTKIRIPIDKPMDSKKWSCKILEQKEMFNVENIKLLINIPPDVIIGRYKFAVEVTSQLANEDGAIKKITYTQSFSDVIVIFNPFNPADTVYLDDEDKRKEYVLEDEGQIYFGSFYNIRAFPWNFGQFEAGILDIALTLLKQNNKGGQNQLKSLKKRSSPVHCSRILSAMVNNLDDDGVLVGNWSGDYSGGVKPTSWSGSPSILKQWQDKTSGPVKFGQCWVFSGVLTTVLRAIGIPARSVTNFKSAHDTEFNMTIDKFVDKNGLPADSKESGDSIWNFHVWNEGWFRRPDLPKGYDGWQAIDATPQEQSSGIFQCGPAPLKAIKNGEIYIGSDTNFLFGEVNADVITWEVDDEGEVVAMVKRQTRAVGKFISTKAVGKMEREDITQQYKHKEGSAEERAAFQRAYADCKQTDYHRDLNVIQNEGDITIDIKEVGTAVNGQNVIVGIEVNNTTKQDKTAVITTLVHTLLNDDTRKTLLKEKKTEKKIKAGQNEIQTLEIPALDYGRHLTDMNMIRVSTSVSVKETVKLYIDSYDISVQSPDCLSIELEGSLFSNEYNPVDIIIKNPLPVALTQGVVTLTGSGITEGEEFKIPEPIPPHGEYKTKGIEVKPFRRGTKGLSVDFDSAELMNVKAHKRVFVT